MNEEYYDDFREKYAAGQVGQSPYSSPISQFGSSIIMLTNPSDDLFELELKLKGLGENEKGVLVIIGERLVNDKGINEILSAARGLISQVTTLSNLEQKDIDIHRDYLGDTMARLLMVNRIRYQMVYPESTRDMIYDYVIQKSVICMKRALMEGERRFWKGSQQEITMRNENKASQGGTLSKVMGWMNK
jgi:hypothetical protein